MAAEIFVGPGALFETSSYADFTHERFFCSKRAIRPCFWVSQNSNPILINTFKPVSITIVQVNVTNRLKMDTKGLLGNIRHDLPASIVVFFVAMPLCLGIALGSGAPLFAGVIAGIVGVLILWDAVLSRRYKIFRIIRNVFVQILSLQDLEQSQAMDGRKK